MKYIETSVKIIRLVNKKYASLQQQCIKILMTIGSNDVYG
jgi:hypothetical protein